MLVAILKTSLTLKRKKVGDTILWKPSAKPIKVDVSRNLQIIPSTCSSSKEMNNNLNLDPKKDPKSILYDRKLTYPKVNWLRVFLHLILYLLSISLITFLIWFYSNNLLLTILIPILLSILILIIRMKSLILFFLDLYQLLAPKKIRMRCRFEPSCSDYMKLAINKYGLIKGMKKGLNRLKRCKEPNGGYDYP